MYQCPGCAYHEYVTAAEFVGDLFCLLHHHVFKQPCRKQIADNLFYVLMEGRSIISTSFHGRKKIYRSEQETTHLMNYCYITVHTHTHNLPLSLLQTDMHTANKPSLFQTHREACYFQLTFRVQIIATMEFQEDLFCFYFL